MGEGRNRSSINATSTGREELACGKTSPGSAHGGGERRASVYEAEEETHPERLIRRLALDSAAALDRGDKPLAQRLAEEGIELATRSGDPKWARRFQHLLRVATDQSIEYRGPTTELVCCFCLSPANRVSVSVRGGTIICDNCVKRCSEHQLEGSGIRRVRGGVASCSFCGLSDGELLFGARDHHICEPCIQRILDL